MINKEMLNWSCDAERFTFIFKTRYLSTGKAINQHTILIGPPTFLLQTYSWHHIADIMSYNYAKQ